MTGKAGTERKIGEFGREVQCPGRSRAAGALMAPAIFRQPLDRSLSKR
jgi:hypothetical protein